MLRQLLPGLLRRLSVLRPAAALDDSRHPDWRVRFDESVTRIPAGTTFAYLATIPRSGTWLSHYLMENFYAALNPQYQPEHVLGFRHYPGLNLAKMHVHSTCPGFRENYSGRHREQWETLRTEKSFDSDYKFASVNRKIFSPYCNPDVRIVFLFRNPLDQAVSLYNHMRGHKTLSDFQSRFSTPFDFLKHPMLDSYLKQYVSFAEMQNLFPGNVLMVPYELLFESCEATFTKMLTFMEVPLDEPNQLAAVGQAVEKSSTANMRDLEKTLGRSLADDQRDPGASHIRSGERGVWRRHFDESQLPFVEERLALFGYRLGDFEI